MASWNILRGPNCKRTGFLTGGATAVRRSRAGAFFHASNKRQKRSRALRAAELCAHDALGRARGHSSVLILRTSVHVALAVPDIDKAVEHYTKVMGFPEAFRVRTPQGETQLAYIQVSKDTFIELQTINAQRPAGIYHFGVVVDDMAQATAMWKSRGADVREITPSSGTKAILSNVYDPNGVRMELLQLPPESLHAQATNRWK
jgi:catechol 2,3-dioxygenase-like lactoylglutathione lyase family enzyme